MTTLSCIALFTTLSCLFCTTFWFPRSREAARLLVVALLRCVRYTWGWCFVAMLYLPIMLFNWVYPPVEYKPSLPLPAASVTRHGIPLSHYSETELHIPPFAGPATLTGDAELTISPLDVLVDGPGTGPVKSSQQVKPSDDKSNVSFLDLYSQRHRS